jgi:outer membrane lipopolysaccharide assembly protein LptE/RlpB
MEEQLDYKQKTEIASDLSSITITIQLQNSTYLSEFLLRELNNNSLHLNIANLNKNKPRL